MSIPFSLLLSLLLAVLLCSNVSRAEVGELPAPSECSVNALLEVALSVPQCAVSFISGVGDKTCCKLADDFFGQQSTKPTGDCFCVEDVLDTAASKGAPKLSSFLSSCNAGFGAEIGYLGAGAGFCPGAPPSEPIVIEPVTSLDKRSLVGWVQDLGEEPILLWTSIMAIPGAIGSLAFIAIGIISVL